VCQCDCGYPNVRAADKPEEIRALEERFRIAEAKAAGRGCASVLADFRGSMLGAEAVLCRSLSVVQSLISSDNELYASFYDLVGMGARRPEDTPVELRRQLADDILFPHYRDKMRFAALSLNGRGVTRYGECNLALREAHIQDRATVLEENSLYFCSRWDLGVKSFTMPLGFRAPWNRRDQLAVAKLEPQLQVGMSSDSFAGVLVRAGASSEEDDFVEVHVYGPLHRRSVSRLAIKKPQQKVDRAILRHIEAALNSIGATVEEF